MQRSTALERINAHDVTDAELERLLGFQDTLSRWTLGRRIVLSFLKGASRRWTGPVSILDMACGRGDLGRSIASWARAANVDLRVHGVDRYGRVVQMARERQRAYPELTFETRDLTDPFFLQAQQFDYVVSEMGLHRERDDRAALFLKTANRMAKRGIIAVDWIRNRRAAAAFETVSTLWKDDAVKHDARVAVERGFRIREVETLRTNAGLEFAALRRHFGYRFSVSGERGLVMDAPLAVARGFAGA